MPILGYPEDPGSFLEFENCLSKVVAENVMHAASHASPDIARVTEQGLKLSPYP